MFDLFYPFESCVVKALPRQPNKPDSDRLPMRIELMIVG
jgi:hypothetical protein